MTTETETQATSTLTRDEAPRNSAIPAAEWFWMGALYVLATVLYIALARREPMPIVTPDEFTYGGAARSLANGQGLTVLGAPSDLKAALYVYVITPAWFLNSPTGAYTAAKVIGSVLLCATAWPVWWLSRQFTSRWIALIPAVLVLAGTWMTSAASILSENLALPLATSALAAGVMTLRRPGSRWVWAAIALSALATWARMQLGVLFAVMLIALVLDSLLLHPRAEWRARLQRYRAPLIALTAFACIGLIVVLTMGQSALGFYSSVTGYRPSVGDVVAQIGRQWIALTVMTAIVPMALTISAAATPAAWRDEERLRPLLTVTITAMCAVILQSAWFNAGVGSPWAIQRYVVYAAPLLLVLTIVVAQTRIVSLPRMLLAGGAVVLLGFAAPAVGKALEERGLYGLWLRFAHPFGIPAGVAVGVVGLVAFSLVILLLWRARPATAVVGVGAVVLALLVVESQAGWKWQLDITRAFAAQYPSVTWLDDHTRPGVTRVFGFGNSTLSNNVGFFNTHQTQTLVPPDGYLGNNARGKQCDLDIAADGVLRIASPCTPDPQQIWNNDPFLRLAFANGRRTVEHPLLGQVFQIDGAPPKVLAGVVLPCTNPTLNISKDETRFGPTEPASNNCAPALRASTFLTRPGTMVIRFAGGTQLHTIQVGGRPVLIPPGQPTTVRIPLAGRPSRLQLPTDWPTAAGAPSITSITIEQQDGTAVPVL